MRLIDADALVNHLEEVIKKQNGKSVDLVPIGELLTFIAREPTINDWITGGKRFYVCEVQRNEQMEKGNV